MSQKFLGIDLSDGVRWHHVLAYLMVAFVSSAYAGAMSVLQPGLLATMGVEHARQGSLTGQLSALQEVVLILAMGPMGALADRIGRRPVYVAGLLLTSAGFFIYPQASSVEQLFLFRIVVALGSAAMIGMMVTVIADYTRDRTRGHANGLQGFIATLGAFIPPILAGLPGSFVAGGMSEIAAQRATFASAASMGVFGAMIGFLGLAKWAGVTADRIAKSESLAKILKRGAAEARDPGVALSYGAAFISRGDLAVTGAFIFLWLTQVGIKSGLSPSAAMGSIAAPRVFVVVGGAMIGAILMGLLADRIRRVTAVAISAGLATLAYLGMGLVEDPTADWVFVLLGVMGVAEISAFVSSQALVGQRARADIRGAVIGFFGVAGAIGILVGTLGGGYMYSNIRPSAPFLLFGALNFVVFVWAMWLRAREAKSPEPVAAPAS